MPMHIYTVTVFHKTAFSLAIQIIFMGMLCDDYVTKLREV